MAQSQISGIINSSIFSIQPSQIFNLSTSESSEFHHFSNLAEHTFIIRASVDFAVNYMIFFLTCQHFKFSFETCKKCGKKSMTILRFQLLRVVLVNCCQPKTRAMPPSTGNNIKRDTKLEIRNMGKGKTEKLLEMELNFPSSF